MIIKADVNFVNANETHITFSTETDKTTVTIEEWDEWGTITLDNTQYDFHCYVDDEVVGVWVYGLTDEDENGIRSINYSEVYTCDMVGDFINDTRVWTTFGDYVEVKPHRDITENFNGVVVGFKENRTIISVEDMNGDVWDCDVEFVNT